MPSKKMNRLALVIVSLMAGCQPAFADTVYQYVVVWDSLTTTQKNKLLDLGKKNTDKFREARVLPAPTTKYRWLELVPADAQAEATLQNYKDSGKCILIQTGVRTETDIIWTQVNKLPSDFLPTVLP